MPATQSTSPASEPAQRPYVPPALVVHGDVQTLTHKLGNTPDQDSSGSFNLGLSDAAPTDE